MRQIGFAILSCLALGLVQELPVSASEVKALKILEKTFDWETRELVYELWNGSDKTITAWRLSLARGDGEGHAQRSVLDQDFFDRGPVFEMDTRSGPIAPGTSLESQWRLEMPAEDSSSSTLSLKVTAIVFEDLTWEGESEVAALILEARAARVGEIGRLLTDLEEQESRSWSGHDWSSGFRDRARELKVVSEDSEGPAGTRREVAAVIAATRLELAQWLEDAGREISLSPDPALAAGNLTRSLRARYESGLQATRTTTENPTTLEGGHGGER